MIKTPLKRAETQRNKALDSRDASKYAKSCALLDIEPEDRLLYEQGLVEILRQKDLIGWADGEDVRRCDRNFLNDAKPYFTGDNFSHPYGRATVLAKNYEKFRPRGKQALIDEEGNLLKSDGYIGVIFNRLYKGVKARSER